MENSSTSEPAAPAPQGKKGAPIKLIAIIGGALLVVGITLLILFLTVFAGPNRADYETALDNAQNVRSTYQSLSTAASATSRITSISSEEEADEKHAELETKLNEYKEAVASLEGNKAFRDEEAGQAYDAFTAQNEKFVAYAESIIGSFKQVGRVNAICSNLSFSSSTIITQDNAVAKFEEEIKPCIDALNQAENVPHEGLQEFVRSTQAFYEVTRQSVKNMVAAYEARSQSRLMSETNALNQKLREYNNEARELSTKLSNEGREAEVSDELNDLGRLLTDKVNNR